MEDFVEDASIVEIRFVKKEDVKSRMRSSECWRSGRNGLYGFECAKRVVASEGTSIMQLVSMERGMGYYFANR